MTQLHKAPCPHPDCPHEITVPDTWAGGTYTCPCKQKRDIRLSWYQQSNPPGFKPMLREAP